jgi:hypothetical protein
MQAPSAIKVNVKISLVLPGLQMHLFCEDWYASHPTRLRSSWTQRPCECPMITPEIPSLALACPHCAYICIRLYRLNEFPFNLFFYSESSAFHAIDDLLVESVGSERLTMY